MTRITLTLDVKHEWKDRKKKVIEMEAKKVVQFRPFVKRALYSHSSLNEMRYQLDAIFQSEANPTICFLSVFAAHEMSALMVDRQFDYGLLKKGNGGTQSLPRYRHAASGERIDNITDWALRSFRAEYEIGTAQV